MRLSSMFGLTLRLQTSSGVEAQQKLSSISEMNGKTHSVALETPTPHPPHPTPKSYARSVERARYHKVSPPLIN